MGPLVLNKRNILWVTPSSSYPSSFSSFFPPSSSFPHCPLSFLSSTEGEENSTGASQGPGSRTYVGFLHYYPVLPGVGMGFWLCILMSSSFPTWLGTPPSHVLSGFYLQASRSPWQMPSASLSPPSSGLQPMRMKPKQRPSGAWGSPLPASFQISSPDTWGHPAQPGKASETFANNNQPHLVVMSHDLDLCGPFLCSVVLSDVVQLRKDHMKVSGQVPNRQGHLTSERIELLSCSHESFLWGYCLLWV